MSEENDMSEAMPTVAPYPRTVAYLRLPIDLDAMASMSNFIEYAYGRDCALDEYPKGWLRVRRPCKCKTVLRDGDSCMLCGEIHNAN